MRYGLPEDEARQVVRIISEVRSFKVRVAGIKIFVRIDEKVLYVASVMPMPIRIGVSLANNGNKLGGGL